MSHEIRLVTETELRKVVSLDLEVIDCIEDGFRSLADGTVVMPPVLSMALPQINAEVDVKTAYVPGLDGFALKVSPGFFNNPALGIPSLNGLMVLLSARTGLVEAVYLDNGYLTDIRTAAAGAVAARHLAPENTKTIGILGTGVQARLQLIAATLVRPVEEALIWGRDAEKADRLASDLRAELGIDVQACPDRSELVGRSQLVITTTPAKEPVLNADWLHPGLHITAMGSDQEDKNELDPRILGKADLFACDRAAQCEILGELRSALNSGDLEDIGNVVEIGDIISGRKPGRRSEAELTVCDLTGTGVQDTAIATLTLAKVRDADTGTIVTT
ncbi:MAG: cyclodeaminase [Roseibium sp.]|uniref:cyclodeaminase n=1 Tax=Roseibium sp. TaxID=1936156 RepID=UPI001B007865|nr:cyclodeaminase [Roseibium sp.]MBO6895438.1 cyclodeaminase [Roseibium sp.]MBO6929982.1 cyclodeaminase [Roseibium sp.]